MRKPAKTVEFEPGTEIDRLVAEAAERDLIFERNGERFRLAPDPGWPRRDDLSDEEYQRVLDETIGSWGDLDADKLIEDIYRWRREGSRYPVDP
jgi:hypothetical protein